MSVCIHIYTFSSCLLFFYSRLLQVFRTLPMRREILRGLLSADLLGFHIYDYSRHFLHACTQVRSNSKSNHNYRGFTRIL